MSSKSSPDIRQHVNVTFQRRLLFLNTRLCSVPVSARRLVSITPLLPCRYPLATQLLLLIRTISTTTMCVSVKGGSRKRQTKSDGVLSNEHTVELRSRIQKLVGMWAEEVSKLLLTVNKFT